MSQFGEHIRTLRKERNILQREVAAHLKTDTAYISKLEKGERQLKREQVILLANLYKVSQDEMLSLWLADKVYEVIKDEKVARKALRFAENKISYNHSKKLK